jgi:DNA-binding MarR family transcriptional regulator
LSQAVARLEKHGWLSRQPDPSDGRYTLAVLSAAGRRRLQEMAPAHVETVREFVFDRLTLNQTRQLGAICQRILNGLPPDESWPSTASP